MPKTPMSPQVPTFSFVSLGCPKNLVDSERMLGLLAQDGYALVPDAQPADLVIINTCGFIDAARQESLAAIREMLDRKRAGAIKGVIVAGCLAERQKEMLLEEVPEVDQVVGVFGREEIAQVADRIMGDLHEQRTSSAPPPSRRRTTGRGCGSRPGTWPTSRSPKGATGSAPSARSRTCVASTSPSRSRRSSRRPASSRPTASAS